MESTEQEQPSITEFELGLRWHQASSTLSFWKQFYPNKIPPHFRIGGSTRYLLSEIEKFEAANPQANRNTKTEQPELPDREELSDREEADLILSTFDGYDF